MDNFVQNISIEDIIPVEFQNSSDNAEEINNLATSIKSYGIIEPLIVRQQNDKYEIIAGKKRYQAAKIAGLKELPVLIKNIDNNFYQPTIKNSQNHQNKFINPIPLQEEKNEKKSSKNNRKKNEQNKITSNTADEFSQYNITSNYNTVENLKNSDIINLAELNQKEIERDELKMNNDMLNNQVVQPEGVNTAPQQSPTFGGRFFPSLEDEPTNMNMGVGMNFVGEPNASTVPGISSTPVNNNLIDLTDINGDNQPTDQPTQNPEMPTPINPQQPEQNMPIPEVTSNQMDATQTNIQNYQMDTTSPILDPMNDSNLVQSNTIENNLNNQMDMSQPVTLEEPQVNSQFMTNQTFNQPTENIMNNNIPSMGNPQEVPQFDMSQSVAPIDTLQSQETSSLVEPSQNTFVPPMETPQAISAQPESPISLNPNIPMMDSAVNQPILDEPSPQPMMEQPAVQPLMEQPMINQPMNQSIQQPSIEQGIPSNEVDNQSFPQKEVEPVLNALKSLATSLQSFGYNINILEEDLGASAKLTIEVEK